MKSFDIDGVLAKSPISAKKKWSQMNGIERRNRKAFLLTWYQYAPPLFSINEPIIAISARKNTPEITSITRQWLNKYYPNVVNFYLLNESRSIKNVVKFKSDIINKLNIEAHYEDNKKVLSGISKNINSNVKLFFWEQGMSDPIQFN